MLGLIISTCQSDVCMYSLHLHRTSTVRRLKVQTLAEYVLPGANIKTILGKKTNTLCLGFKMIIIL